MTTIAPSCSWKQTGLRFAYRPGARLDLHTSAHGRAILAFTADPEGEIARLGSLVDVSGLADVLP